MDAKRSNQFLVAITISACAAALFTLLALHIPSDWRSAFARPLLVHAFLGQLFSQMFFPMLLFVLLSIYSNLSFFMRSVAALILAAGIACFDVLVGIDLYRDQSIWHSLFDTEHLFQLSFSLLGIVFGSLTAMLFLRQREATTDRPEAHIGLWTFARILLASSIAILSTAFASALALAIVYLESAHTYATWVIWTFGAAIFTVLCPTLAFVFLSLSAKLRLTIRAAIALLIYLLSFFSFNLALLKRVSNAVDISFWQSFVSNGPLHQIAVFLPLTIVSLLIAHVLISAVMVRSKPIQL
jgi:hypothetical protein